MDFFDKLGEFAKNTIDKTNDNLEITRINSDITMEQGNIQVYERQLGQYYWAKFVTGEALDPEAMHICDKIVVCQDKIKVLEGEIDKVKRDREAMKAERAEQKRLEAERAAAEAEEKTEAAEIMEEHKAENPICSACGAELAKGQRFCGSCGKPAE